MGDVLHVPGVQPAQAHPGRQGRQCPRPDVPPGLAAVLGQGVQEEQGKVPHHCRQGEPQLCPQLRDKGGKAEVGHAVGQQPVADAHQHQGQGDGGDEQHRVHQGLEHLDHAVGRSQMVGRPHRAHEGVGGPHGEIDGEHQTKHQQLGAWAASHIGQIDLHHIYHLSRQEFPQGPQNPRHIQLQQAQQGAEEDQEGKQHEQQVKGQGRALSAHVMPQIPAGQQIHAPQKAVFRRRECFHGAGLLSFRKTGAWLLIPILPRYRDNTPRWPLYRCGRWGSRTARGAPAAFPPGRPG